MDRRVGNYVIRDKTMPTGSEATYNVFLPHARNEKNHWFGKRPQQSWTCRTAKDWRSSRIKLYTRHYRPLRMVYTILGLPVPPNPLCICQGLVMSSSTQTQIQKQRLACPSVKPESGSRAEALYWAGFTALAPSYYRVSRVGRIFRHTKLWLPLIWCVPFYPLIQLFLHNFIILRQPPHLFFSHTYLIFARF